LFYSFEASCAPLKRARARTHTAQQLASKINEELKSCLLVIVTIVLKRTITMVF